MDNNELDKALKEKLKNTIKPSKELENKIAEKIEEQKKSTFEKVKVEQKKIPYKRVSQILSFAAVFVLIFTFGILYKGNGGESLIPGISDSSSEVVKINAIKPTKLESGIIAKDSEFIITVDEENSKVESVQRSLYIEPALEYEITKTGNKEYKLKFKQNIPDNIILKLQYVKNQITEDSWAYQTNTNLSVIKTFPENEASTVSQNTVIEIYFSYANVENFEENVSITPKVNGKWEHLGKIWRFTPSTSFKNEQKYIVTVNKNVKAEGKVMENNYKFFFTVGEKNKLYYHYPLSIDQINTFSDNEQIIVHYTNYDEVSKVKKVVIRKFENTDDFIDYLQSEDYAKSTELGQYEFEDKKVEEDKFFMLKKSLPIGYYVASAQSQDGTELFNAPIQINNLQSYALETEREIIVWTSKDGKLAEGIEVNYLGKTIKTDKDGIAKIGTEGTANVKYAKIGNDINKLVVGFNNFTHDSYPYSFVYTDRVLYKSTDTVNVWGFVPRSLFYDKIDENEFYLKLGDAKKERITVDKNGSFEYKIDLKNYKQDNSNLNLYYKDYIIGSRTIIIENYELQNYEYEVIFNKNYVYDGEKFEFDVKVKHITGILVPEKAVAAEYNGKTVRGITDENGIAHFTFTGVNTNSNNESGAISAGIQIYNGDLEEYTNSVEGATVYVLQRDVFTEIRQPEKEKDTIYSVKLYKLLSDTNKSIEGIKDLYDGVYDTEVNILLEEETHTRYINGYRYNEYTKQKEPMYEWNSSTNYKKISTVTTKKGEFTFDKNLVKMKEDNDETWYSYKIIFEYKDKSGKLVQDYIFVYHPYVESTKSGHWDETEYYNRRYCMYRYFFETEYETGKKVNVGDTIDLKLKESTSSGEKEIQNQGKLLRIAYRKDIKDIKIIENNDFDYVFSKNDETGIKITGAYFVNGKFYRMPSKFLDLDENSKKIDIEVTSDKEEYKPGDKVTLNIKTTNNGKPIKSVVNISVANEGVFFLEEDIENELINMIYGNDYYPGYNYSSYLDVLENRETDKGGGGGGDGVRGKFGDTAFFDTVETDGNGTAKVTFTLTDNVTTYRITTHAANKELYIGENRSRIVSTLDFFIQYTEPRGIKTTDDAVLTATSIADKNYKVDFEFTIEELNKTLQVSENTNRMASVNFGKLEVGKYHVLIKGTDGQKTDSIKYEFEVVETTQEVKNKTTINITNEINIKPSKNPITLEIYNKQMKQYLDYIDFIEETTSERLDTRIAYNGVQKIKNKYYKENYVEKDVNIFDYMGKNYKMRNLKNGSEDLLLTALIEYYAGYNFYAELDKEDNVFEYYLYLAAKNQPVLEDLKYLKEVSDTENYNKLLLTLSFEFLGDYEDARIVYNNLNLTDNEKEEYASLIAIIDTFINKTDVVNKINKLIETKPADEYLRFAILSFFSNNSSEIAKEENVKIMSNTLNETVSINGLEVKTYTIYDSDLSEIKFETSSEDIMTSYYYQTSLENINNDKVSKDIVIKLNGAVKKNNRVTLVIDFSKINKLEGEVRIALPNNLRLAEDYDKQDENYYSKYYLSSNKIDYITYYKQKNCNQIKIPLMVSLEGNYKFENVVFTVGDGIYHISNSLEIK